jgi:hypothetical protein
MGDWGTSTLVESNNTMSVHKLPQISMKMCAGEEVSEDRTFYERPLYFLTLTAFH